MTAEMTKFIIDLLVASNDLKALADRPYLTELPQKNIKLEGSKKTIIGFTVNDGKSDPYFYSDIRNNTKIESSAIIEVLTSSGNSDTHCNRVISSIFDSIIHYTMLSNDDYRIIIRNASYNVKPAETPGRWLGTISLNLVQYNIEI